MRLDSLHIQNFRCYEDATFDFQPGFNLVVGVNGSGKTSLLQAVALCFRNFVNSLGHPAPLLADEDARSVIQKFEDRLRFERAYPLKVNAAGAAFGFKTWSVSKERNGVSTSFNVDINIAISKQLELIDSGSTLDLPMIAVYQANRRWLSSKTSAESAVKQQPSRFDAYSKWFDAAANLQEFESWVIGKTLERLQRMSRSGPREHFDDELQWVNSTLKIALPESQGIEYDLDLRSLIVTLGSKSVLFSDLSDGQRGMIALVADIARRICLLNPQMGSKVLALTTGVIIIDELDIHLHPAWQRRIVSVLRNAFPKIQFIAASHSPQIIGSLKPEEVIVLNNGDASHPRVTYGLDSSSVLEEVMGVTQREPEIERLLTELFSTLEDNDLKKAKVQLEALKKKAPDLPEFAGAEALMRRKEILGK
ncbi:AAA family ATPase [Pseudomonas sp. ADAK2]|uniref:AAA family ATPase n=1 Tax=unclassified Pseudomonas TaxID=196821 RepID=UPI001462AB83|nr:MULTISPECIES: AAA family ATPase [unclassified Pseudomonas]QJI42796.1 AAA family ATPase [Pseudomonas sp. ADAK7]QJI49099.1 AAA family ATPase [Pseudomonas sp. ADAK2]